jgi:MFS family permease
MATGPTVPPAQKLTSTHWLIVIIAALGFAFDIYELLMMPLIQRPALAHLLGVNPDTDSGHQLILNWQANIMYASAVCGGVFGLLGGYLTDIFGRRRVLVWSILLYAFSAFFAGFSTSPEMLLVLRCTTFIGVCVEFVAAVAWLSELFPNPRQREAVLGYTQAFSSVGGLMVTGAYLLANHFQSSLPMIQIPEFLQGVFGDIPDSQAQAPWRYTLISGVIPALPLIIIRPFLPESPAWQQKKASGTLKRPSLMELFRPAYLRTTLVTAVLFACGYGAAFGAIQFTPQIVPGLVPGLPRLAQLRKDYEKAQADGSDTVKLEGEIRELSRQQESVIGNVQLFQELGGLAGRFALAWLAVRIISRRKLLRLFLVPGLLIIPLVFFFPAAGNLPDLNLEILRVGIFFAGFLTIAQFSFWGNYLPRVYPVYLRGTGESFSANVGGRMVGTAGNPLTAKLMAPLLIGPYVTAHLVEMGFQGTRTATLAYSAAATALLVYAIAVVMSWFLPEPRHLEGE